jgi:rubrerythrin
VTPKDASPGRVPVINTVDDLLTHAQVIERDAVDRYQELAAQMEMANNPRVAKLFASMAVIEQKHVTHLEELAEGHQLPVLTAEDQIWPDLEAPETVPIGQGHYRMTEFHALKLALECEQRAQAFYADIAASTSNSEVKTMALHFADDEAHHVSLVNNWLARYPEPPQGWDADMDDPVDQE